MNRILSAAAMLAAVTAPCIAEMRYDRNLEKAAMEIVASKMGDIRGGFSYMQKPQLVIRRDEAQRIAKEAQRQAADDVIQGAPLQASQSSSIATF
jgi:hypothetical protein